VVRHILEQAAAGEHVDRLQTAADAEDGHGTPGRPVPGEPLESVAGGVHLDGADHCFLVLPGVNVRAACQDEPVHLRDEAVALGGGRGLGSEDRVPAVAPDPVRVQFVLAGCQVRVRRPRRVGHDKDDEGGSVGRVVGWHAGQDSAWRSIRRNDFEPVRPAGLTATRFKPDSFDSDSHSIELPCSSHSW